MSPLSEDFLEPHILSIKIVTLPPCTVCLYAISGFILFFP